MKKKRLTCEFTWYSISLGVACSPLATGSGVTATIGEAGSVCCCDGGGAGLGGSSSLWESASDRSSIMLISASLYARRSACGGRRESGNGQQDDHRENRQVSHQVTISVRWNKADIFSLETHHLILGS